MHLESGTYEILVNTRLADFCINMLQFHTINFGRANLNPEVEFQMFLREAKAYRRLKDAGLCKQKIVPDFYGTITNILPTSIPELIDFHQDKLPPNAILIEYVHGMRPLDLSNFSNDRMAKFQSILNTLHELGINHGDVYPRNMMIVAASQEVEDRVLFIDFDSAQLSPPATPERFAEWVALENEEMKKLSEWLEDDFHDGKIDKSWNFYYEYDIRRCPLSRDLYANEE